MMVKRDHDGQLADEWTDRDYQLLFILEEISAPDQNEDKTLAAYMADIIELFEPVPVEA